MENELMRREVEEAVVAGERALSSLESAAEKLSSARNWGLFDMFGGGFISGTMKHSRINDATIYMENAKNQLQIFQRELKDIHVPMDFQLEIGTFLTFTDFFFDDIVSDYLVQSRIGKTREEVGEAIRQVRHILGNLQGLLDGRTEG